MEHKKMYLVRIKKKVGEFGKVGELLEMTNNRAEFLKRRHVVEIITYLGDYIDLIKLGRKNEN